MAANHSLMEGAADVTNDGYPNPIERPTGNTGSVERWSPIAARPAERYLPSPWQAWMAAKSFSNSGAQPPKAADLIRAIQRLTALDWGTIAQTIGVSRRSVHHWLSGGSVSPVNEERVFVLHRQVLSHHKPGEAPGDYGRRLTQREADGVSLLGALRREVLAKSTGAPKPAPTPLDLLTPDTSVDSGVQGGRGLDESITVTAIV